MTHIAKFGHQSNLSSDMLVHWVKVIWAKDGDFGPHRAEKLIFSDKTLACSNDSSPIRKYFQLPKICILLDPGVFTKLETLQ